jgi:hypothetical protein
MDPNAICFLIEGRVEQWRGLATLERSQLPACVGELIEQSSIRFSLMTLAVDTYRSSSGGVEVRAYWAINGGLVELVDVKPLPAPAAETLLAGLDGVAATHVYSVDERAAANLVAPRDGSIEEVIYADKGLALAIARWPSGEAVVVRIRGFKPMPFEQYVDEYVRFEPEALY